jgi:hypothetical protein
MNIPMRQYGDPIETRDGAMHTTADTVLGTQGPRILPNMTINAEKAPEVLRGGLGVTLTGGAGPAPRQIDVDAMVTQSSLADLLSAADLAALKAILQKYSGNPNATTRTGITSSDASDPLTMGQGAAIQLLNKTNADFWAKRAERL